MKLLNRLRKIRGKSDRYIPAIRINISRDNLLHNLNQYRSSFPEVSFVPVLKSNAYGHGLAQVAEILEPQKLDYFVVDSLYEALKLRDAGIKTPLLIIGYTDAANILRNKIRDTAFTVTSLEQLRRLVKDINRKINIHLKLDTGMHRQGFLAEEIAEAVSLISNCQHLILEGVCSHFADADSVDSAFTRHQISLWNKLVGELKERFPSIKYNHISATAGTDYLDEIDCNMVRLGLGLYGINPSPTLQLDLKPVLEMTSVIGGIKEVQPGETVGYNCSYAADKLTKIAIVPVGYYEGVDRRLSNLGSFKINGSLCPIVGKVSMNMTAIDVTAAGEAKLNDEVTVISANPEDKNSAANIAQMIQAISYEILIHLPQHLRRNIV